MSGFNYKDEAMAEIQRKERMQEAEKERLISHIRVQKPKRVSLFTAICVALGKKLVGWGTRLQHKQPSRHTS